MRSLIALLCSLLINSAIFVGIFWSLESQAMVDNNQAKVVVLSMEMLVASTTESEPVVEPTVAPPAVEPIEEFIPEFVSEPIPDFLVEEPEPTPEPEPVIEEVVVPTMAKIEKPKVIPKKKKPIKKKVKKPKKIVKKKTIKKKPKTKVAKKISKSEATQDVAMVKPSSSIAQKGTKKGDSKKRAHASSGSANAYKAALRRAIARNKRYPKQARRMQRQGTVSVSFNIASNGQISSVRVIRSSGNKHLDRAAIKAVKKVSKFKPRPSGVASTLTVPINFTLK